MGLSKEEVEARVAEALSTVGGSKLAERPAHHLSEGEKRIISIAGVLAMRPKLIIYDEPGANLDIRSRRRLIRLLQSSQETILIASHDLEVVLEVCNRVVLIDQGSIVADGNPHEIMGNVQLMEAHGQEKHPFTYSASALSLSVYYLTIRQLFTPNFCGSLSPPPILAKIAFRCKGVRRYNS